MCVVGWVCYVSLCAHVSMVMKDEPERVLLRCSVCRACLRRRCKETRGIAGAIQHLQHNGEITVTFVRDIIEFCACGIARHMCRHTCHVHKNTHTHSDTDADIDALSVHLYVPRCMLPQRAKCVRTTPPPPHSSQRRTPHTPHAETHQQALDQAHLRGV